MPNSRDIRGEADFGYQALEEVVRGAGSYVQPSDDLRPKTLEAARSDRSRRTRHRRLASIALSLVLLAVTGLPEAILSPGKTPSNHPAQRVRDFDLHKQASLGTLHEGFEPAWALLEAFMQLRSQQAELFDESN